MKINISFLVVVILAVIVIISDSLIYFLNFSYERSIIIGFIFSMN